MSEEPNDSEPDETMLAADATPCCPHCLAQISPLEDYGSHCGEAVGQLTGVIPFVNIRFQTNFYGKLWRKLWYHEGVGMLTRAICLLCIMLLAPVMFLGLPVVIWDAIRDPQTTPMRPGAASMNAASARRSTVQIISTADASMRLSLTIRSARLASASGNCSPRVSMRSSPASASSSRPSCRVAFATLVNVFSW